MFHKIYIVTLVVNIYTCTLLVIFGCATTLVSLLVFWHSKYKTPRIGAKDYLTLLTIVNSIYLIVYWYSHTTEYILEYYDIKSPHNLLHMIFFLKNTNKFVCKLLNFALSSTRCCSTFLTMMFSLERSLAIYFPLKLRRFSRTIKSLSLFTLLVLFFVANFLSVHAFYFYEILYQDFGKNLSHPYIKAHEAQSYCWIRKEEFVNYNRLTFKMAIFTLALPFLIIILSNLAIVLRLNRTRNVFRSRYYLSMSMSTSTNTSCLMRNINLRENTKPESNLMIYNRMSDSKNSHSLLLAQNRSCSLLCNEATDYFAALNQQKEKKTTDLPISHRSPSKSTLNDAGKQRDAFSSYGNRNNKKIIVFRSNKTDHLSSSSRSISSLTAQCSLNASEKELRWLRCANKKMHSTKILIVLTSLYIFLNIPCLVNIYLSQVSDFGILSYNFGIEDKLEREFLFHTIFLITEIFTTSNYSICALLLFASGKIYRRRLHGLTMKCVDAFNSLKSTFLLFCKSS